MGKYKEIKKRIWDTCEAHYIVAARIVAPVLVFLWHSFVILFLLITFVVITDPESFLSWFEHRGKASSIPMVNLTKIIPMDVPLEPKAIPMERKAGKPAVQKAPGQKQQNTPPPSQILKIVADNQVKKEIDSISTKIAKNNSKDTVYVADEGMASGESGDSFYAVPDQLPTFNGKGWQAFREYISKNLKYPEWAANKGIKGFIMVQFIINKNGSVVDVTLVKGVNPVLDNAVLNVVKNSPRWTPGKKKWGKPVPVQLSLPINFVL